MKQNEQQEIKPITPVEAKQQKYANIPLFVIKAFNSLIVSKLDIFDSATFSQDDVIQDILGRTDGLVSRDEIFKNKWLDVEELYSKSGWDVEYDKPGYNEPGEPYFKFKKKVY